MNAKVILLVLIVGVAATQAKSLDRRAFGSLGSLDGLSQTVLNLQRTVLALDLAQIRGLNGLVLSTLNFACRTVDTLISDKIVGTLDTSNIDAVVNLFTKRSVTLADADATLTNNALDLDVIAPILGLVCPSLADFRLTGDVDFDLTRLGRPLL